MTAMTGTCCPIRNVNVHPLSTCTYMYFSLLSLPPPPPPPATRLPSLSSRRSTVQRQRRRGRPASHRDRRCEAGRREGSREGGRQVGREGGREGARVPQNELLPLQCASLQFGCQCAQILTSSSSMWHVLIQHVHVACPGSNAYANV